jgi:hypothetical protein
MQYGFSRGAAMPVALLALVAASTVAPFLPAFDPRQHKTEIAGRPAQVLVLGTTHLSGLPKTFDPRTLEVLLQKLARFKPTIITIEALSGEECDTLRRFKDIHGRDTWETYCPATDEIEQQTGLTVPAAEAELERTLASWPKSPEPAARRRLAMLFMAANDRASATVQWLRLPPTERHAGDGLTQAMVATIERKGKPLNENYAIGAALAARLGLERVYPVDDHTSDWAIDEHSEEGRAYESAVQNAWRDKPPPAVRLQQEELEKHLDSPGAVLSLYRLLNARSSQREAIAADMGRNARFATPQLYGRQYLAWWETRNLRIAANIRATLRTNPQARVLSIIGSTHKAYLDDYLDMMQDVHLVDVTQFLR